MFYASNQQHVGQVSLKNGLEAFFQSLPEEQCKKFPSIHRNESVRLVFKNAVQSVFKQATSLILAHINAVYILKASDVKEAKAYNLKENSTVLVVYCDDALVRSELQARAELLQIYVNKRKEHVGLILIMPSRFAMKKRYAYDFANDAGLQMSVGAGSNSSEYEEYELTNKQCEALKLKTSPIEDNALKKSICSALEAYTAGNMVH